MGYQLKTVNDNSSCWINLVYVIALITLYILFINIISTIFGFNKRSKPQNKVRCPYKKPFDSSMIIPIE